MQPRTRAVLAALNIPVWMGRGGSVQRARVSVWRDDRPVQAEPVQAQPVEIQLLDAKRVESAQALPSVQAREAFQPTTPVWETRLAKPIEAQPIEAQLIEVQRVVEPLTRFSVQARVMGDWIVLVPEQTLQDSACQRLWDNISQAMQADVPESFIWPLAEGTRWQRMDGAAAALAGFLYRIGHTQRVGLMGDLPDQVCPDRIERLPSLPELLADPAQKRRLWLLLRANQLR